MFSRLVATLQETGSFNPRQRNRRSTRTDEAAEVTVLASVAMNPHVSTRQLEHEIGIPKTSVHRILTRHRFHPYHVHLHQELHGNDFQNRVQFCQWAQQQILANPNFFSNVLFTDECSFSNKGQVNTRNMHYWSSDNPRWLRQVEHQRQWRVNVWCGMLGTTIIGPYFINGGLNGTVYANFLRRILPPLLDEVPLRTRMLMWYQHDGCPAHNALRARRVLNRRYPARWIGRGGTVTWPARSPDLNPLDFFLWGCIKDVVYRDIPTTPEDMQERIVLACNSLQQATLEAVNNSFIQRVHQCIGVQGHHFEHL